MALVVTTVASGGLPIVDVTATAPKLGLAVTEAARGIAVTKVAAGKLGLAATFVSATGGAVAETDPNFANVLLLCGFEGADGSTTFADESSFARAATAVGNAQIDTAQFKFGASSYLGDGTGDYVTFPHTSAWNFAGAFTIEFFLRYPTARAAGWHTLSHRTGTVGQNSWLTYFIGNGAASAIGMSWSTDGSADAFNINNLAITTAPNTWYHLCYERDASNVLRLYLDGVMKATSAAIIGAPFNAVCPLSIGARGDGLQSVEGWIDEVRITGGIARYGSDGGFTIPAAAYPRS